MVKKRHCWSDLSTLRLFMDTQLDLSWAFTLKNGAVMISLLMGNRFLSPQTIHSRTRTFTETHRIDSYNRSFP